MKKSLLYYWRIHLAVLFGAAVACAVLTGALLVGDSMRGSLRDITLNRLGDIDVAMVADRYLREAIAKEMHRDTLLQAHITQIEPLILLTGSSINSQSRQRAANTRILGVRPSFPTLYQQPLTFSALFPEARKAFPPVIINRALQEELGAELGQQILISFEQHSDIHRESLFGEKKTGDLVRAVRVTVAQIIEDQGAGRLAIEANQARPFNLFIDLNILQERLEQPAKVNALFLSLDDEIAGENSLAELTAGLQRAMKLEDLGLKLITGDQHVTMESREFILGSSVAQTALHIADSLQLESMPVLTYLANRITHDGRLLPYSIVTALDPAVATGGSLQLRDSRPAPLLEEDEILLNEWAAADLQVSAGDSIDMHYFVAGTESALAEHSHRLTVRGIVHMSGLADDASLTPDYPGIHDVDNISDWDPPFPVDLQLIRPKDEQAWDDFKATPKGFVSLQTGIRLWKSRFGDFTAIRLTAGSDRSLTPLAAAYEDALLKAIGPARAGFIFRPVKTEGLAAATGATDFSGLFIGFSMFLIISAAILAGLLFRLGVEQRVSEIGVLSACGYTGKRIRSILFREAWLIAGLGSALGLPGAAGYAWLMMYALRSLWSGATGTGELYLHITTTSLAGGLVISLLIILFSVWMTLRRLRKVPPTALLAGEINVEDRSASRTGRLVSIAALAIAILSAIYGLAGGLQGASGIFFLSGALLLGGSLGLLSSFLRNERYRPAADGVFGNLWALAGRNITVRPGRSMVCIALVACASFMIVAVGANRRAFDETVREKSSGAGGFPLMAASDVPLVYSLNNESGQFELGFSERDSETLSGVTSYAFRLLPGDDASCLNLYKPEKPRLLGVPPSFIRRGGFTFTSGGEIDNPWTLLEAESDDRVIPAIADANSAQWIMHLQPGDTLTLTADDGRDVYIVLRAMLATSIFQSEMLISERQFQRYFPNRVGYRYFLLDAPFDAAENISATLEDVLSSYGFDVTGTADKLAAYQAVENTYLSVFQTLGGLGLLLGTFGLGIVLLRNVIERSREIATLRAFGYRRERIGRLLFLENTLLIVLGLAMGTVSAAIAVAPHLIRSAQTVPWFSLSLTLLIILLAGIAAGSLAVSSALKRPLLPALKSY